MHCPMLDCGWQITSLISTDENHEPPRIQDDLVTQFSFMAEHLQDKHDAVVGGLMPDGTYPPGHKHAGEKAVG